MAKKSLSQVKTGAVLSYILIIANALYGLIITPYIISHIGAGEYGVYKTIASLSSSLMVLDLGLGGTVQRFVANYIATNKESDIPNFTASCLVIAAILNVVIIIISAFVFFAIQPLYGQSFSFEQISIAKKLFLVITVNMLIIVISNVFNGLITGYNKFVFGNGIKLIELIIRVISLLLFLNIYRHAITIVVINVLLSVFCLVAQIVYIKFCLNVEIRFERFDRSVFSEAGKYTVLMFLTSIATQIFSNLDNVVIGSLCGPAFVTVYSIGLMFFAMFQNLSAGVAGVMLPTVTNVLHEEKGDEKVQSVVIRAGRVQFILLGAALIGFICIGKDFVNLWLGKGFEDVYIITILLLAPAMFELCINVCHSILRAKNKLEFRTVCVFVSAILNALFTIVLVKKYSYIGAAVATAGTYIICSLIAMNVYYYRALKLPMLKIYAEIFSRIWICLLISGTALFVFSRFVNGSWIAIILDIIVFCTVYIVCLLFFGLTKEEKKEIPFIRKYYV